MATTRKNFSGTVLDLAIADKNQLELFTAIGRTKGPFQGVINWPYLNGLVQERSRLLLSNDGEEAWRAAGGTYGDDGRPTFLPQSIHAAQIVQEVANDPGGFIWTDAHDIGWAVSLMSVKARDLHTYGGLAISWNGGGRVIDPAAREEYLRVVQEKMAELGSSENATRLRLQQMADRMWLYERGEQLLWAIHAAVLMQRRSIILLPDVALAEIVWGGCRDDWPQNWRDSLSEILWSLSQLHMATLRIGALGWRPQFAMRSVAVAHCELLEASRGPGRYCRSSCPLWNCPDRHNHFLIQIGYGFLGLLEHFAIADNNSGGRQFDFDQKHPKGDAGKLIVVGRKQGEIVPVHLPTKVFGGSKWSQLTRGHRGIVQGLVREVTRVKKRSDTKRRDRADVLIGNQVPDVRGQADVACPLLRRDGRYVCFNGNGRRRGLGYLIAGKKNHGWLAKCGYVDAIEVQAKWSGKGGIGRTVRCFLKELGDVAQMLRLTVVGIARRTGECLNLKQITEIAQVSNDMKSLNEIHIRVYGPEDYLERCREVLAERGEFLNIPGGTGGVIEADGLLGDDNVDLKVRMQRAGLTQDELARHLGVTKSFVSKVLKGRKQWPEGMRARAEAFMDGDLENLVAVVGGRVETAG